MCTHTLTHIRTLIPAGACLPVRVRKEHLAPAADALVGPTWGWWRDSRGAVDKRSHPCHLPPHSPGSHAHFLLIQPVPRPGLLVQAALLTEIPPPAQTYRPELALCLQEDLVLRAQLLPGWGQRSLFSEQPFRQAPAAACTPEPPWSLLAPLTPQCQLRGKRESVCTLYVQVVLPPSGSYYTSTFKVSPTAYPHLPGWHLLWPKLTGPKGDTWPKLSQGYSALSRAAVCVYL